MCFVALGHTTFGIVRQRHIVSGVRSTTTNVYVGAAVPASVLIQLLHPVDIRIKILVHGAVGLQGSILFGREVGGSHTIGHTCAVDILLRVVVDAIGMIVSLVSSLHIGDTVNQVGHLGKLCDALIEVERELRLAHLTRLGGDDDNAVTTTHTINGGRGSIFQYRYALNVFGIEL